MIYSTANSVLSTQYSALLYSWGRGVEKNAEACEQAGLPVPKFEERHGGFSVELLKTFESAEESKAGSNLQTDGLLRRIGGRKEGCWEVIEE